MRSKEERFTQCHRCGKTCYNRGYVVVHCSQACKEATQASKVKIVTEPCAVCGKVVTRKRYASDTRNVKSCCCSLACQKQWAMVANRGAGNAANIDWVARSKKAKAKYYKEASRRRYEKSEYRKWLQVIIDRNSGVLNNQDNCWNAICANATCTLSQRLTHSKKLKCKLHKSFADLCRWSIKRVQNRGYDTLKEWEKKCYSTCKNMKWKRRLRNVKKNTLNRTEGVVQQLKQLSIWEFLETQQQDN